MIVKCSRCGKQFNVDLDDSVMEIDFTCPNCGHTFKVKNVKVTEVETVEESKYDNYRYTPRPTTVEGKTQEEVRAGYEESLRKRKRGPVSLGMSIEEKQEKAPYMIVEEIDATSAFDKKLEGAVKIMVNVILLSVIAGGLIIFVILLLSELFH